MVLIQYKLSQKNQFTLEFPANTTINQVLETIIEYNNLRIYLNRLIWSIEELANKGIMKPPELQGVSYEDYQQNSHQFNNLSPQKKQFGMKPKVQPPYRYAPDKNNHRQGLILSQQSTKQLLKAVEEAKKVMQPSKEIINKNKILEAVELLRNAVMEAYPAYIGLPEWQPSVLLLQQKLQLQILECQIFELHDKNSSIWWAGKQLQKNKLLSEYVGNNEKTKIIVKLQKQGGQQPPRQPPVDNQTYRQMVKYYYKKQDENKQYEKKLIEKQYEKIQVQTMREQVHMSGDIRYKPF